MAITRSQNQQILESLGFQGQAGEGRGDQFLRENPQLIESYATARQRIEPEYSAAGLMQTVAPGIPITDVVASQVRNPTLASGAEFTPVTQQVQSQEILQAPQTLSPTGQAITSVPTIAPPTPIQTTQAQAQQVDPSQVQGLVSSEAGQVTPQFTQAVDPAVAQQMTVDANATVQGQLENLLSGVEEGEVPLWARGAVAKAQGILASKGLGASSIAGEAITAAVINSALPIAAADAKTYFQADLANLNNRQQTELENLRVRQQNMLTDTSIANAAEQINAASELQREQFVAKMVTSIRDQNANRMTTISQFNAAEENRASALTTQIEADLSKANAQIDLTVKEFNAKLAHERETFNSQMQFAVNQSNVVWRRQLNTANTTAINAAMQANVQNRFNMSASAQNNIWQQFRDEAAWAFTASENAKTRAYNAAQAATNRQFSSRNDAGWLEQAGSFAASIWL